MAVVDVGEVRVTVGEPLVNVGVGVRITEWITGCMGMLMMSVVSV